MHKVTFTKIALGCMSMFIVFQMMASDEVKLDEIGQQLLALTNKMERMEKTLNNRLNIIEKKIDQHGSKNLTAANKKQDQHVLEAEARKALKVLSGLAKKAKFDALKDQIPDYLQQYGTDQKCTTSP